MNDLKFKAKDYEATLYVRVHNYFAGLFGRKDCLRSFCANNGIDYMPISGKKYRVPDSYLIDHNELKFISGVRDKSILSIYDTYKDYQIETSKKINEVIGKIDNQEDYIESIKEKYSSTKQRLSRERNPQGKLKFQKDKDSLESKIANEKSALTELKQELSALEKTKQANIGNWIKQIEIVDGIFELRKNAFEKNLTKRIRRTLNYADFICLMPEHSESVKKIMKGEYDVEEK